jgi:hypothetical protein
LILVVITFSFYFFLWVGGPGGSLLSATFRLSTAIGWLLASGVPFVIGASLLLCSDQTRNRIVEYLRTRGDVKFAYLFMSYIVLTALVMMSISVAGLVVVSYGTIAILGVLPQLLGLALLISLIMTPIYVLVAIVFDSMSKSIVIGFFLSIAIVATTGQPGFPTNYPEI